MYLKTRKCRPDTYKKLSLFLDYCTRRVKSLPKKQQRLMRLYMLHAHRILNNAPISDVQVNNLLQYVRFKMKERKKCPFTNNLCLSDFPATISIAGCKNEGPCVLIT